MRRRPSWRNAAPGVQPQVATPGAPIVVGEPTAAPCRTTAPAAVAENVPQREVKLTFATIAPPPGSIVLRGSRPDASVEFGMRSDELVANALLNLEYTPSPSLLPVQSQLKVYLNDELMGVLPVTKEQLGKKIRAQLPIDPPVHHRLQPRTAGVCRSLPRCLRKPRQQHAVAGRRARKLSGSHLPVAEGA
ncbi:cellulose synthase regulator protein [Klebsiella aerogenes]|nr:cellulose synthase regulator protein [Klebsiella aerogenes]